MNIDEIKCCLGLGSGKLSEDEMLRGASTFAELFNQFEDWGEMENWLIEQAILAGLKPNILSENASFQQKDGLWLIHVEDEYRTKTRFHCSNTFLTTLAYAVHTMMKHSLYRGVVFRQVSRGVLCEVRLRPPTPSYSLARKEDGTFVTFKELGSWIKGGGRLPRILIDSVVQAKDAEGLKHLLSFKKIARAVPKIKEEILEMELPGDDPILQVIHGGKKKMSYSEYISLLTNIAIRNTFFQLPQLTNAEMNRVAGHEIIYAIGNIESEGSEEIGRQVAQDGGDWYLGYKMLKDGHGCVLDLKDRKKAPLKELEEVLNIWNLPSHINKNHYLGGVLKGVNLELKMILAKQNTKYAERLFMFDPQGAYIPLMKQKDRGKALGVELSL